MSADLLANMQRPLSHGGVEAAERGIIGKELATIFKLADIAAGLDFTQVRVL